jgi:hypothetical protein
MVETRENIDVITMLRNIAQKKVAGYHQQLPYSPS